jgi:urea transport system permease protein
VIGIVAPNQFAVLPSILVVCWVAVGGRGTVWGAVLGAILVNWGRTRVSESHPDNWVYFQGLLFIVVLAFAPGGIMGLLRSGVDRVRGLLPGRAGRPGGVPTPAVEAAAPEVPV